MQTRCESQQGRKNSHLLMLLTPVHALPSARDTASFSLEIESFVLGLARMEAVANQTAVQEVEAYEARVGTIRHEREQTAETIEALKRELAEVQQDRQNKLEYDALASEIMKVGTRTELEAQLAALHDAIGTLVNDSAKYTEVMNTSHGRFESIASQLEMLRADVGFEVGERERRAVEREGADGDADGADVESDNEDDDDKERAAAAAGAGDANAATAAALDGDGDNDGRLSRASSRAPSRRALNPAAPAFQPGGDGKNTQSRSRASSPGALSIPAKRTRVTRDATSAARATSKSGRKRAREEGEMSDGGQDGSTKGKDDDDDDDEEEGAA